MATEKDDKKVEETPEESEAKAAKDEQAEESEAKSAPDAEESEAKDAKAEEEEEKPKKKASSKDDELKKTVAETPKAKGGEKKPEPAAKKPFKNFFPARELPSHEPEVKVEKKPALLLAEFDSSGKLLHAAERIRDAGYKKWDTHAPFPIHGMDAAMGLPDSKLGWIVLAGGLTGVTTAVVMIWWMNGVDYPIIIGGKPGFALPSSIPIMFELTVLFSAFAAVFGMFGLNRIPEHYHPLFESERFRGFSDDKFFVAIEVDDPKFHPEKTRALLEKLHPTAIELVEERVETVIVHEEDH